MPARKAPREYQVGTVEKALDLLEAVETAAVPCGVQDLVRATGIQRTAVYRLLSTLERRGYILRLPDKTYSATARRKRFTFGIVAPLSGNSFRDDLYRGLREAATHARVELLALDNAEGDSGAALQNAQQLIDRRVDVAVMFQPVGSVGHLVADRFAAAGIPMVAVEAPASGAFYFGANNYQAGRLAGAALGRFALERWAGSYDRIVLLESSLSSLTVYARVTGVLEGLRQVLGEVPESRTVHLDGRAHFEESRASVAEMLRKLPPKSRLLISGFNDLAALGALRALRDAGREEYAAVAGQNATAESHAELRNPSSRLIVSVAYFPERYGTKLVQLGISIANREAVPPAVYTGHVLLTPDNIDQHYQPPRE